MKKKNIKKSSKSPAGKIISKTMGKNKTWKSGAAQRPVKSQIQY